MSFWKELKRRNVYKVGVAYAIVAWLIIQAAAIVSPALQLPKWTLPFIIIFLSIGFIVALLLAWAYEVTPEGIKRTKEVPLAESITHLTGQKLNYIVTGLLVVAVAVLVIDNYIIDRKVAEQKASSIEISPAPEGIEETEAPKSIAVIPFVNLSPDPDQEYFVDGLSEELLNCLSKIPDLRVISRTSSFAFKGSNKKLQEIANDLGVEHILEGSVRKSGSELRITAQLIRAEDDVHLWSEKYDRELKDIFAVQEDIAIAVASELKAALGIGKSFKQLGGTDNVEAYELYLTAKAQFNDIRRDLSVLKLKIDTALELDAEFALAWALKALICQQKSTFVSGDQSDKELDESLKAAQMAIGIEPKLAEAHAVLGSCRTIRGDWIEAELAYRNARDLGTQSALVAGNYFQYLFAIGYVDKANKILKEALRNDPLNQRISFFYMLSFIFLGDRQKAEDESDRLNALFGEITRWWMNINFYELVLDDVVLSPWFSEEQIERIKSPEDFLAELRLIYVDPKLSPVASTMLAELAAHFGDPELALKIMEINIRRQPADIQQCWNPVMREVRQLPRFKELVREIGLVDYWNEFGWPDTNICRPLDDGDFVCD